METTTQLSFERLHALAHSAGMAAAEKVEQQMVVAVDGFTGKQVGGAFPICGFGWVEFAGNTAWGRWAKGKGLASKGYPKGLHMWVHQFNQSYDQKVAYAKAYAEVLRANGIEAYGTGRLD